MWKIVWTIAGLALIAALTLFTIEGVVSVSRWKHSSPSLVYGIYAGLFLNPGRSAKGGPAQPSLHEATREEIEALIPDMIEAGVGMGNVPYRELVTGRAAINDTGPDGCRSPKPGISKIAAYIRSGDYDRFDPPSLFYDAAGEIGGNLQQFIDTYSVKKSKFNSNAAGERVTIPLVDAAKKILVAGDSVAAGSMIDDSETISSHLQRVNFAEQYVNLGVNGAAAEDIVCRLGKAALRYRGNIAGLVYVYCENDFDSSLPYGRPEEVISWLKEFSQREQIPEITVVFAPYIYNIVPHLTRFASTRGATHNRYAEEGARLKSEVEAANFHYISIADVAREEAQRRGTDFAVFSLFVDHVHLSDYGVSLLVEALNAG
jgi:lysophospholipase L1-like esterase